MSLAEVQALLTSTPGEPLTGKDLEEVMQLAATLISPDFKDNKLDYRTLVERKVLKTI